VIFTRTAIPDVVIVEPKVHGDERGYFVETYRQDKLEAFLGYAINFCQDNESKSSKGVLRGLHYQIRQTQGKLVRVIRGEVFDVAVDLRRGSPTFGRWVSEMLSADNRRQIWIPEGFAHGFLVLSESAEFLYKTTDYYARDAEGAIRWDDPEIGIQWPEVGELIIGEKDRQAGSLAEVSNEGGSPTV
jgi:dTDP-4-dehydrorhamnose 3,5-epimerase